MCMRQRLYSHTFRVLLWSHQVHNNKVEICKGEITHKVLNEEADNRQEGCLVTHLQGYILKVEMKFFPTLESKFIMIMIRKN